MWKGHIYYTSSPNQPLILFFSHLLSFIPFVRYLDDSIVFIFSFLFYFIGFIKEIDSNFTMNVELHLLFLILILILKIRLHLFLKKWLDRKLGTYTSFNFLNLMHTSVGHYFMEKFSPMPCTFKVGALVRDKLWFWM